MLKLLSVEMVGMIEELEILVVVGVFERLGNCATLSLPHRLGLCSLQCAVIAAETLTVGIVVVVRTVVGDIKECVVVFDHLLLCDVFGLVVNRESVGLTSGIFYTAWVKNLRRRNLRLSIRFAANQRIYAWCSDHPDLRQGKDLRRARTSRCWSSLRRILR